MQNQTGARKYSTPPLLTSPYVNPSLYLSLKLFSLEHILYFLTKYVCIERGATLTAAQMAIRQEKVDEKQDILTKLMNNDGEIDVKDLDNAVAADQLAALAVGEEDDSDHESEGEEDGEDKLILLDDLEAGLNEEEEKKKIDEEGEGEGDDRLGVPVLANQVETSRELKDGDKSDSDESDFDAAIMEKQTMIKGKFYFRQ